MMDNIDYEGWKFYLLQLFFKYGVEPCSKVTELGCGTGMMTRLLDGDGFRMTGIDISEDMLEVARSRSARNIKYLHQDMRSFEFSEEQDAVISICDSMNYLLTVDDLSKTMKSAWNSLKSGGVFIFDLKTEFFYIKQLNGKKFTEDLGNVSCTWRNKYDKKNHIHTYYLDFSNGEKEEHIQKVFNADEIKEAAMRAGFDRATVYDAFSFDKPKKKSNRIYVVLRK